jgi:methyltransferase
MVLSILILAAVTLERGVELLIAGRNTRRLKAAGAVEVGARHYPLIVGLHAVWLLALWALAWDRPAQPILLALFLLLQAARIWVLVTLGPRWTTRIIIVPGESLVRRGPYRFVDHPNYLVVAGEIALLPLVFGLAEVALLFTVVNALVLAVRIRAEDAALGRRLDPGQGRANLRL